MDRPTFPTVIPREHGLIVAIDKTDLPDTWPEFVTKLGSFILDTCDAEPTAFKATMQEFKNYLIGVYAAIEKYDEAASDDKPVPDWYQEIGACWTKDEDDQDWLCGMLDQIINKGCTEEVELKCNLLMTLLMAPWPGFFDEMITQVDEYLLITK